MVRITEVPAPQRDMRSHIRRFLQPDALMAAVAMIVPVAALLSANALAPIVIVVAVLLAASSRRQEIFRNAPRLPGALLVILVGTGLMSTLWSIVPSNSLYKAGQLLFLFAAVLLALGAAYSLDNAGRELVGRWLVRGMIAALALLYLDAALGGVINHYSTGDALYSSNSLGRYKRGVTVLALLLPVASYWVWLHAGRAAALALIGGTAAAAFMVQGGSVMAAISLGAACAVAAWLVPRSASEALAGILFLVVLSMPLVRIAVDHIPAQVFEDARVAGMPRVNSAMHRFLIWQFTSESIAKRPLTGWGLDSSRAIPGGSERPPGYLERLPLHPHNAALQLWLELGVIGALVGGGLLAWAAVRIGQTLPPGAAQAAAAATLMITAVMAFLGFGIWQSWWISAIGLAGGFLLAVVPQKGN